MWNVIQSNASPFGQPNDRGEVRYVGQETPTIQPVDDGNTIRELTYSEQETGTYLEDY